MSTVYIQNVMPFVKTMLPQIEQMLPYQSMIQSLQNCRRFDYAIMEKLCKETDISFTVNKKTILYKSYWNDIGSFSSLYKKLLSNYVPKYTVNLITNLQ